MNIIEAGVDLLGKLAGIELAVRMLNSEELEVVISAHYTDGLEILIKDRNTFYKPARFLIQPKGLELLCSSEDESITYEMVKTLLEGERDKDPEEDLNLSFVNRFGDAVSEGR